jgi:hypothetical protein
MDDIMSKIQVAMTELTLTGESDDWLMVRRDGEFCLQVDCGPEGGAVLLSSASGKMVITGYYHLHGPLAGVWSIGVALAGEGLPLPDWEVKFAMAPIPAYSGSKKPYSPIMSVLVPHDVTVKAMGYDPSPEYDRILARAQKVLGTRHNALAWLSSPYYDFGGKCPVELLATDEGIEQVMDALGRIEYGVYS